jgi:Tol biopolymer transport system component
MWYRAAAWKLPMRSRRGTLVKLPLARGSLICAALLLLAPPAPAAEPGLVFSVRTWEGEYASRDVPGGVESTPTLGAISTVNADGTGLKQVVPARAGADFPVASLDGKWLYFQAGPRGGSQIYRCKWDGSGATSLTKPDLLTKQLKGADRFDVKEAFGFALSKDGMRMVYTVHDGANGRVVIDAADGSTPAFVAPHLGYTYMARLDPANDRVVFSGPARGYRLLLAALPDGKPVELTPDHSECFVPQFTPDGKTIVFVRRDGDVYRVGADGKNLKRLTQGNKYVEFRLSPKDRHGSTDGPDIAPDGKRVAFIAVNDGVPNVFVVDIDGGNRRQVTSRTTACGRVKWSPDGKRLSFVSFEGKYPQLFVVPAAGGAAKQLTKLDGGVNFAHWRPE